MRAAAVSVLLGVCLSTGSGAHTAYLAPDNHTDYGWNAPTATYDSTMLAEIDYYRAQANATAGAPSTSRAATPQTTGGISGSTRRTARRPISPISSRRSRTATSPSRPQPRLDLEREDRGQPPGLGDRCVPLHGGSTDACSNGIDDDGDGLVDMADPGCASASDRSERSAAVACDDGFDNDGDGLIDFPADPKCSSPADTSEGPANCGLLGLEVVPLLAGLALLRARAQAS